MARFSGWDNSTLRIWRFGGGCSGLHISGTSEASSALARQAESIDRSAYISDVHRSCRNSRSTRHQSYVSTRKGPLMSVDDSVEHETWTPQTGTSTSMANPSLGEYPYYKTHAISCFTNSCKLAIILNDIIMRLYSRRQDVDLPSAFVNIRDRLDTWRNTSSPHLVYNTDKLPRFCPPPHILTQKFVPSSNLADRTACCTILQ